jgi:hypothetical protein
VAVSVSHPLADEPSQSARPAVQAETAQTEAAHEGVPPGVTHARPQPPQCEVLVRVSVSQPLTASRSQSAKPATQVKAQAPREHAATPLGGAGHDAPQRPQCVTEARTSVSQPLVALPSQSPKPSTHAATAQEPISQTAVALGGSQRRPQAPQWEALVRVSVSHPLAASPSQSAKPVAHAYAQVPPAQEAAVFGRSAQARPQAPQWEALVRVSVSHPLAAVASQSPNPSEHVATAQAPLRHAGTVLGTAQRLSQRPQWEVLARGSTQAPAQHA